MVQVSTGRSQTELEREIQTELRSRAPVHETHSAHFGSPTITSPALGMPDYVEHREGATEIGKLSAEAVVREYEETAKEIESMGNELLERVKQCEALTRDTLSVNAELREIATRYREEAKRAFEHIEACSLVVAEARKTCADLKDKIPLTTGADRVKPRKK